MVFAALALALVVGCANPANGGIPGLTEGYGAVTMQIQGTMATSAPAASLVAARAAGDPIVIDVTDVAGDAVGTLTLTDARVNLGEIELEQADSEIDTEEEGDQSNSIEFGGPYVVDFVNETVTPDLPQIEMLPGTYDNIKLKLDKVEADDEDGSGGQLVPNTDPLFGHSIYFEGTYSGETSGGAVTDVPFTLSFDLDEEFELSATGDTALGFVIEEGQLNPVIVAFRLARWFEFNNQSTNEDGLIDFTALVVGAGPSIVLDETATGDNATIREVIKDNIKISADYGEDHDGDGQLEADEDDDPDTEDAIDESDGHPDDGSDDSPDGESVL